MPFVNALVASTPLPSTVMPVNVASFSFSKYRPFRLFPLKLLFVTVTPVKPAEFALTTAGPATARAASAFDEKPYTLFGNSHEVTVTFDSAPEPSTEKPLPFEANFEPVSVTFEATSPFTTEKPYWHNETSTLSKVRPSTEALPAASLSTDTPRVTDRPPSMMPSTWRFLMLALSALTKICAGSGELVPHGVGGVSFVSWAGFVSLRPAPSSVTPLLSAT